MAELSLDLILTDNTQLCKNNSDLSNIFFIHHHHGWIWFPFTTRELLSPMCRLTERPGHHPLWWYLLPGVHQDLLGPVWPHGCVHLSTVPRNLHTTASAETQSTRCEPWATAAASRAHSFPVHAPGILLWLLCRPSQQSCQIVPHVLGLLLWNTRQATLRVVHLQETQAGGWDGPPGQEDLPPAWERPGAVLSLWPDVHLCAMYSQRAPQPQHYLSRRRTHWKTSQSVF